MPSTPTGLSMRGSVLSGAVTSRVDPRLGAPDGDACEAVGFTGWHLSIRQGVDLCKAVVRRWGAGITSFMLGGSEAVRVDQFRSPPNSREEAEDDGLGGR